MNPMRDVSESRMTPAEVGKVYSALSEFFGADDIRVDRDTRTVTVCDLGEFGTVRYLSFSTGDLANARAWFARGGQIPPSFMHAGSRW